MEITNPVLVLFEKHYEITVRELCRWLTDKEKEQLKAGLGAVVEDIVYEWQHIGRSNPSHLAEIDHSREIDKMVDRVKSDPAYQAERGLLTDGGVTFK